MAPYIDVVPKDYKANLAFREQMLRQGAEDPKAAEELWIACRRDILFYINTFVWTFDPRLPRSPSIPMITWDFQDRAIMELAASIGKTDILFEKSRDMGASWNCIIACQHPWQFSGTPVSFLLVSRNEDYVDKARNPKSLFWKLDFILSHLPTWLSPNYTRVRLSLQNDDSGATIDGESTTGDVGRGDRRTAVLLDEFAAFAVDDGYKALSATRDTTRCRIFNFTPKGTGNAAYDMAQSPHIKKIRLHWSLHPDKRTGLYVGEKGDLIRLDRLYVHSDDYAFILDGKLRSPWYDAECERCVHKMEIASELDIDYQSSTYQFFDPEVIARLEADTVRTPTRTVSISFDHESLDLVDVIDNPKGELNLWLATDGANKVQEDRVFVVGADIGAGTGASPSVLSIADRTTGEKVGEYVTRHTRPEEFAKVAVVVQRWFNDAMLIWEANGPGRPFGDAVIELKCGNVWYRRKEESVTKSVTDVPGWFSTKANKGSLLAEYRRALNDLDFVNRSKAALRECTEYIFLPSGSIEHSGSLGGIDPTGSKDNHGDRVIADALCWRVISAVPVRNESEEEQEAPDGSMMARRNDRQSRQTAEVW